MLSAGWHPTISAASATAVVSLVTGPESSGGMMHEPTDHLNKTVHWASGMFCPPPCDLPPPARSNLPWHSTRLTRWYIGTNTSAP